MTETARCPGCTHPINRHDIAGCTYTQNCPCGLTPGQAIEARTPPADLTPAQDEAPARPAELGDPMYVMPFRPDAEGNLHPLTPDAAPIECGPGGFMVLLGTGVTMTNQSLHANGTVQITLKGVNVDQEFLEAQIAANAPGTPPPGAPQPTTTVER